MPRYEFSEGTSNKFWQIDLNGTSFTTTFGRIGSAGQSSTKTFASDAKARAEYDKLIAEKTKKGYLLVGAASAPSAATPTPRPPKVTPAATPAPMPAIAPAPVTAPAPTPVTAPPGAPSLDTAAVAKAAKAERASFAITPRRSDDAASAWATGVRDLYANRRNARPRVYGTGAETTHMWCAVQESGHAEHMPATPELAPCAALLQLAANATVTAVSEGLVVFWATHVGLAFALEVFVTSLRRWNVQAPGSPWSATNRPVFGDVDVDRTLDRRFANRTDRVLHALWLGATDDERARVRARAEELRATGSLLQRSAIASCVLDEAWIDADLREHATTRAPAIFSPEALLRARDAGDLATYFDQLPVRDLEFYPVAQQRWGQAITPFAGYAFVERFGLAGIDIAVRRATTAIGALDLKNNHVGLLAASAGALLEVARLARDYQPVVDVAMAVIDTLGDHKLSKDEDPRPAAYDCLRASPAIALPLVEAQARRTWAKNLLPQLQRLAGGGADDRPDAPDATVPAAVRTGKLAKPPELWQPDALPRVAFTDGTLLPRAYVDGLGAVLKAGDRVAIAELKRVAEPASLGAFGWELFQAWLTGGAPSKDKWAFVALGLLGDDEAARRVTPLIRAWPGESQHQRAVLGLDVLGDIGSDVALMMLNGIAQKVKFKGLQERARAKMDEIAAKRGMTAEQLADRLVPDLDLEDDGSKTLDFGPRSFRVGFDESLSPFVVDATGTRLKDLPKPNSKDDAALGAQAVDTWKAMKKDVRALASIQILRLELGMGNARRWTGEEFRNFFVEHPLLTHLVRRLVWGVYAPDGRLERTFRVAEDRTYADQTDDACEVPAAATIGIAHRLHLTDADAGAWGKVFADYELAQPFEQLARATYRLTPDERTGTALKRFEDRVVETKKLLGLMSRGWRKGTPQDAGCISELYKPIRPGLIASLPFELGLYAGSMDYVDPTQKLHAIDFAPDEPSWGTRQGLIALTEVDDVTLSEVIRDIESMGVAP